MGAAAPGLAVCSARDASGAPVLEADETVTLTQTAVALHVGDEPATPPGTLFVTTRCVTRGTGCGARLHTWFVAKRRRRLRRLRFFALRHPPCPAR
jgi:hypothetical protein